MVAGCARRTGTEIWLDATESSRQSVTMAANTADRHLLAQPTREAVHLSEGLWKLDVPPLILYFHLSEDETTVEVTNVVPRM